MSVPNSPKAPLVFTPVRFNREHDVSHFRTRWVFESETRKAVLMSEVWDINSDKKWRKAHPEAVAEHAETVTEVHEFCSRVRDSFNACLTMPDPTQDVTALVDALKQAQDTLGWAQHFINHANQEAIPATLTQIKAALGRLQPSR